MASEEQYHAIKPDPAMMEEVEDLLLSYINTDLMETSQCSSSDQPPSPPYSTSSSVDDGVHGKLSNVGTDLGLGYDSSGAWPITDMPAHGSPYDGCLPSEWMSQLPFMVPWLQTSVHPYAFMNDPSLLTQSGLPRGLSGRPSVSSSRSSFSSASSSSSDSEQPKKKRGRKKRDSNSQGTTTPGTHSTPPILAPAPIKPTLMPLLPASRPESTTDSVPVKIEPTTDPVCLSSTPPVGLTTGTVTKETPTYASTDADAPMPDPKVLAAAKRQERLIKNRAAALLSRKRKREHLTQLEQQTQVLTAENENLKATVASLEAKLVSLEKENCDLKSSFPPAENSMDSEPLATGALSKSPPHNNKSAKTTGMVFMILLFSFALFNLPSHSSKQLTVDEKQLPLITSTRGVTDVRYPYPGEQSHACNSGALLDTPSDANHCSSSVRSTISASTDLVTLEPIETRTLQAWIQDKMGNLSNTDQPPSSGTLDGEIKREETNKRPDMYLYSSQFARMMPSRNESGQAVIDDVMESQSLEAFKSPSSVVLRLISPLDTDAGMTRQEMEQYLRMDVQVMESRVIQGPLIAQHQDGYIQSRLGGLKRKREGRRKIAGKDRLSRVVI
ncbi:uncharacterized protein BYT42DRAFT_612986 [Radiomyces spectabilis]|uniref:uncharacterized protein n=1 Tax=Radiomyces spectabilis TaxID=64574 RepID=UPI00221FE2EA|nr:uncharacterized protein BYT42DRAFT_612986 [Radiomyces spectabilis]KAI8381182.1 hypothetical protein BYT42DRAFT_612986 [Radiomyces spectabilis]